MNFELKINDLNHASQVKSDLLIVLVSNDFQPSADPISALCITATKAGDFDAKKSPHLFTYQTPQIEARRVLLTHIGDGNAQTIRKNLQTAIQLSKASQLKKIHLVFADQPNEKAIMASVLTLAESTYIYTTTKTLEQNEKTKHPNEGISPRQLEHAVLLIPKAAEMSLSHAFEQAVATVQGVEFAKEWGNRPANYATPTLLANAAKELAKKHATIECEVLGLKEVEKLGMGAFISVARGTEEPLRFIILSYKGALDKKQAPVVLVGKGITFDTGGISLKPGPEMDEMKFDMCGAASVLGVFESLANLQPEINVIGLIPACENMPSGHATKPGDVVTSMNGQTIEILNTDAEGRLILCDALTYAKRFEPRAVIDIATLTGACVISLGRVRSGLFSNDDELANSLQEAGEVVQDLCWRMPLDDEYALGLKSNFADCANIAGREGGSITAAKFLHRFTKDFKWAHLDIAGTAWKTGANKGATGRPVGLLLQFLLNQIETSEHKGENQYEKNDHKDFKSQNQTEVSTRTKIKKAKAPKTDDQNQAETSKGKSKSKGKKSK